MKMSKKEFVERYKRDQAQKDSDRYFGERAAMNFRDDGRNKNIRKNYRGRVC